MTRRGRQSQPPWHMWGTSQLMTLGLNNTTQSIQLGRVNFKRPTTWSFLFTLAIANIAAGSSPGLQFVANFTLIVGLGRSQFTLPNFCLLAVNIPTTQGGGPNTLVWSSATTTSGLLVGGTVTPEVITQFPAQDIQVSVTSGTPVGGVSGAVIEVGAQFAPIEHVRPDWFLGGTEEQFAGDEVDGH